MFGCCAGGCTTAGESETTFVSGTKGRAFRGATLIRRCRTPPDRRASSAFASAADRGCPLSLALCAGAYWRGQPSRSVRRLPGPFPAVVAPVSTSHRVSLPTNDGYSSRSSPVLRDVAGSLGVAFTSVKRGRLIALLPFREAGARDHRQLGVARKPRVGPRQLAQDEPAAASGNDDPPVATSRTKAGRCYVRCHAVTIPTRQMPRRQAADRLRARRRARPNP